MTLSLENGCRHFGRIYCFFFISSLCNVEGHLLNNESGNGEKLSQPDWLMVFNCKGTGKHKTCWISQCTGQDFTVQLLNTSLKHYFHTNLILRVQEIRLRCRWVRWVVWYQAEEDSKICRKCDTNPQEDWQEFWHISGQRTQKTTGRTSGMYQAKECNKSCLISWPCVGRVQQRQTQQRVIKQTCNWPIHHFQTGNPGDLHNTYK